MAHERDKLISHLHITDLLFLICAIVLPTISGALYISLPMLDLLMKASMRLHLMSSHPKCLFITIIALITNTYIAIAHLQTQKLYVTMCAGPSNMHVA